MKRFISLMFLVFVFLFPSISIAADEQSGPSLWEVGDEDTTIYIFGTIHLLDGKVNWKTPKIIDAFESADVLVLELAPDQISNAVMGPLIQEYGLLPQGLTLKDKLTQESYAKIGETLTGLGAPPNALDPYQPWMAATILTVQIGAVNGYLPQFGVDLTLMNKATSNGVPIRGLETAEVQVSMFSRLSDSDQQSFIDETLADIENFDAFFVAMRDAWMTGDLETLDKMTGQELAQYPAVAEEMLYKRNRNWAATVEAMLDEPGIFFIAVGTGHLTGEQNLVMLLEQKGINAERH